MAEKVKIEIPGIGKIDADNAASEATLLAIKEVLEKNQKSLDGLQKGGGKGKKASKAEAEAEKELKKVADNAKAAAEKLAKLEKEQANANKNLSMLSAATFGAIGNLDKFGSSLSNALSQMASVGNDLGKAAQTFQMIPLVGGVLSSAFGAVAGAATGVVKAFQESASVGATFGGSVQEMSRAASAAGMTLDGFGKLMSQNANNLMLLGGTTEEGAKKFTDLNKSMKQSGLQDELLRMGYSTEQVNDGMLKHIGMLARSGSLQTMSTSQIAKESAAYMKELDALAKVTGSSRQEKQKELDALQANAKVQAALSQISDPEQQRKMQAYILSFPKEAQGAIADMISTSNLTTDESIKLNALMPGLAQDAMSFGRSLKAGGKMTDEQLNASKNRAVIEGQNSRKNNANLGMYADEFGNAFNATTQIAAQGVDSWSKALKEGKDAAANKNLAEKLEKSQQALAAFSNEFQMFLANSGLLDVMMSAFKDLAGFIAETGIPMFYMLSDVVQGIIIPALNLVGDVIIDYFMPAIFAITDFIEDNFIPILGVVASVGIPLFISALAVKTAAVWASVTAYLAQNAAMLPFILAIGKAVALVIAIGFVMKKFGLDLGMVGDSLRYVGTMFKTVFLKIKEGFFTILNKIPGMRGDFNEDLKQIAKEQEENQKNQADLGDKLATRQQANLAKTAAEEKAKEDRREKRDSGMADRKHKKEMKGIQDKEDAEKKASEAAETKDQKLDMSDPINMLKGFADQQNSQFSKDAKAEAEAAKNKTAESSTAKPAGTSEASMKNLGDQFGKVAAQFESGGKAYKISTGHGDAGGKSYGAFQLAGRGGKEGNEVEQFLKKTGFADQFKGMKVGSADFDKQWEKMAQNKDFEKAQYDFAKTSHYDPQMAKLKKSGIDLSGKGSGVHEAVMSTANQYGANSDTILKALKGKDTDKMSDKDIINAIQDYKAENVKSNFKSSSSAVQAGVAKRIEQERAMLLGEKGTAPAQATGEPSGSSSGRRGRQSSSDAGESRTPGGYTDGSPASALQGLVRDGINPTIVAFQNLNKTLVSGMQVKTPLSVSGVSVDAAAAARSNFAKSDPRLLNSSLPNGNQAIEQSKAEEAAKAKAEKEKAEKEKAAEAIKATDKKPGTAPVQETPESLLSSLNMKMDELIRVSRQTADLNTQQLSVQKNMSGDLMA